MQAKRNKDILIITLDGDLTFDNSTKIKSEIKDIIKKEDKKVVLDFGNVKFIDSSGVGVMISIQKTLGENDSSLNLAIPDAEVSKVFKITRVDRIIDIFDNLESALEGFNN